MRKGWFAKEARNSNCAIWFRNAKGEEAAEIAMHGDSQILVFSLAYLIHSLAERTHKDPQLIFNDVAQAFGLICLTKEEEDEEFL